MLDIIGALFQGIFGLLNTILPDDPFASYIQGLEGMRLGLGWLNWFVPMDDFVAIFMIWLMAGLAVAAVRFAVGETLSAGTALV